MGCNIKDFLVEIERIISQVEKEIVDRNNGIPGDGSVSQLESIRRELEQIRIQVQNNTLPPKDERRIVFARCVVDGWDFKSSLGNELCNIAHVYEHRL